MTRDTLPGHEPNGHSVGAKTNPLHRPRVLCLHGGGTNARIFKTQCRVLERMLEPYFRFVYAEAPYDSNPGPDVLSVYAGCGPFKRWLRWLPEHEPTTDEAAVEAIDQSLDEAMDEDDNLGGTGPWVGLLGFSQGAKLAASMLFRQQVLESSPSASLSYQIRRNRVLPEWKFAVLLAGRAPIVSLLDKGTFSSSLISMPSQIGLGGKSDDGGHYVAELKDVASDKHMLDVPTIHVHGLQDVGIHLHRELLDSYCTPGSTTLVEWSGGHRVPLKSTDIQPIVDAVLELATATGAI